MPEAFDTRKCDRNSQDRRRGDSTNVPDGLFLTVAEVAAILRVSPETVYRLKSQLGGFSVGTGQYRGRVRFTKQGIEEYVASRRFQTYIPNHFQHGLDNARAMRALVVRRIGERRAGA